MESGCCKRREPGETVTAAAFLKDCFVGAAGVVRAVDEEEEELDEVAEEMLDELEDETDF